MVPEMYGATGSVFFVILGYFWPSDAPNKLKN